MTSDDVNVLTGSHVSQKIDDMKMIIEDLEALKELADELEENHVETEKQMQEEIGLKHNPLYDFTRLICSDSLYPPHHLAWYDRFQGPTASRAAEEKRKPGRIGCRLRKHNLAVPRTSLELTDVSHHPSK